MRQLIELDSKDFGIFVIEQCNPKFIIHWDFYRENDGGVLELDSEYVKWILEASEEEVVLKGLDLSDMPKRGLFNSYDDAYNYLVSKFGNLE